jgi:hypothetical protein
MRKFLLLLAMILFCFKAPCMSEEPSHAPLKSGNAAHSSVYDSLTFSMASWGLGLAVGIGLLCALMETSSGSHAHSDTND